MKRWLGVLMVFCMLFTMVQPIALAAGDPTLTLGSAQVTQGDTGEISIPVSIQNNPGLTGLRVKVTYPDALAIQKVTFTNVFGTHEDNASDGSNPVTLFFGGGNAVTANGVLATITFTLKANAAPGTYDFTADVVEATNVDQGGTVTVATSKGQLTVASNTKEATFAIDSAEAAEGETGDISVPVSIQNNPGLTGLRVRVTYPDVLTLKGVNFANVFATQESNADEKSNPVTLFFGGADEVTANGTLATLTFTLNADAKTGTYDFKGDVVEATNVDKGGAVTVATSNGQLTVNSAAAPTVVVTFSGNGGTLTTPATVNVKSGEAVAKPATDPTRDGYEFTGWFTDKDGKNAYVFTNPVTAALTLYAGWREAAAPTVVVTFDGNEGTPAITTVNVKSGDTVTKPADPKREGYDFTGWFTDQEATKAFDFATKITKHTTLYAGWKAVVPTVIVTFNGNGGTLTTPATVNVKSGDPVAKPATDPTRANYDFTGWFTDKDGKNAYVFTTPVTAALTLYAGWKEHVVPVGNVVVTFDANGGTLATPATVDVKSGETVAKPATDPSREAYTFRGWFTDKEATKAFNFNTPINKPTTLYAGWAEGGCYIATSVYGSYDSPEVWTLRHFRDDVLGQTWYGRLFIKAYYATSPTLVRLFGDAEWFRDFWRGTLDNMVEDLQEQGFESSPYQDKDW